MTIRAIVYTGRNPEHSCPIPIDKQPYQGTRFDHGIGHSMLMDRHTSQLAFGSSHFEGIR
ncbi:hypothetical protein SBA3_2580003 [Candidatus Sulfopaludibacter sp. SbA3]|nr:hypothetical protein SBA3_2580003 [Candidatus Sulfopaludibacter sp. SbA3]